MAGDAGNGRGDQGASGRDLGEAGDLILLGLRYAVDEKAPMLLHDWFDWTNAGVGTVGLALTVATLLFAKGAKKAATEAKEAIWKREASDSFSELSGLAAELVQMLQFERPIDASVRARDLVTRIPRERGRFERFLADDFDKLKALESDFQRLAVQLSSPKFLEKRKQDHVAIQTVFEASRELNAIYGRLLARLDKE